MKKINKILIFSIMAILVFSPVLFTYAISLNKAYDADGGYNPHVKGSCTDYNGTHTDYCKGKSRLIEFYPSNTPGRADNTTTQVYCDHQEVQCLDFFGRLYIKTSCSAGGCKRMRIINLIAAAIKN